MGEIFTAELCAESKILSLSLQLFFKFAVAECMSELIAVVRECVEIFNGCFLDYFKILFC